MILLYSNMFIQTCQRIIGYNVFNEPINAVTLTKDIIIIMIIPGCMFWLMHVSKKFLCREVFHTVIESWAHISKFAHNLDGFLGKFCWYLKCTLVKKLLTSFCTEGNIHYKNKFCVASDGLLSAANIIYSFICMVLLLFYPGKRINSQFSMQC